MIVELEKLCADQEIITACYREGLKLQEAGFCRYPPCSWDKPAIAAVMDGKCVACVNFGVDLDEKTANIDFAFCSPEHPHLLAKCLIIWRGKMVDQGVREVRFTYHAGNEAMHKAGNILGAELSSMTYKAKLPAKKVQPVEAEAA